MKHTENFVKSIIANTNLTRIDVIERFRQKGIPQDSYRQAVNYLRECDADTIHWILSIGRYAQ